MLWHIYRRFPSRPRALCTFQLAVTKLQKFYFLFLEFTYFCVLLRRINREEEDKGHRAEDGHHTRHVVQ